jgi:hypothetical protein
MPSRDLAESRVTRYSVPCHKGGRGTRSMITRSTRSDTVTSTQPETGKSSAEEAGAESCRQKIGRAGTRPRGNWWGAGALDLGLLGYAGDTEYKAGKALVTSRESCGVSARKSRLVHKRPLLGGQCLRISGESCSNSLGGVGWQIPACFMRPAAQSPRYRTVPGSPAQGRSASANTRSDVSL